MTEPVEIALIQAGAGVIGALAALVAAFFGIVNHFKIGDVRETVSAVEVKNGKLTELLERAFQEGVIKERRDVAEALKTTKRKKVRR